MCDHQFEPAAKVFLRAAYPGASSAGGGGGVKPKSGVWLQLEAVRDIRKGEPITISYSQQSEATEQNHFRTGCTNDDLLLDYGFLSEHNPNDMVEVAHSTQLLETVPSFLLAAR
jgi:hypothetical protein